MSQQQEKVAQQQRMGPEFGSWWSFSPQGWAEAVFMVESWSRYGYGEGILELVPYHREYEHELSFERVRSLQKELARELRLLTVDGFWNLVDQEVIRPIGT